MNISKEDLNKLFEENGYFIEDYALSKAYLSLYYLINKKTVGQEVYSLCLDGPSGCGKTSFVEAYTKVASKLLGQKVEFINFQLDAETGKDALYEDIDVVATFENDTTKIRIPGTILKAIKAVNEGKYVILKMDEYDKARDSTDTFFNNFLQEGRINTIQHGDIQIKPENLGKLQVFLCKNDLRVDLSEPMVRRNRVIRLDYMKPDLLFKILQKFTKKNKCDEGLLNLVTLIYENIYKKKDMYTKLPSCSECQQAIMDAYLLLQVGGFSRNDIYTNIIENMLKFEDDVKTFEANLDKGEDKNLKNLITEMKSDTSTSINKMDLNEMIARNIFSNESTKLTEKISEMQSLINEYREKFSKLESQRKKVIEEEIQKILLQNGNLVATTTIPNIRKNFGDESLRVKRGYDIFEISKNDWTDVAEIYLPELGHDNFINKLIEHADKLDITLFENGILLHEEDESKLIVINDIDKEGKSRYRIMSSTPVIPSTYLNDINSFISFAKQVYDNQPKTTTQIVYEEVEAPTYSYSINTIIYNDNHLDYDQVEENVYSFVLDGNSNNDMLSQINNLSCTNTKKAVEVSKKIMSIKKKVLKDE